MPVTKDKEFVGFRVSEARKEEIQRRARRDGRSVNSWLNQRLEMFFEIDDRLMESRRTISQKLS